MRNVGNNNRSDRGCTTPKVIKNIQDALGEPDDDGNYDVSILDGFEELSEENQEKVKRALQQGHVDDDEWRGASYSSHGRVELVDDLNPGC